MPSVGYGMVGVGGVGSDVQQCLAFAVLFASLSRKLCSRPSPATDDTMRKAGVEIYRAGGGDGGGAGGDAGGDGGSKESAEGESEERESR